MPHGTNKTSTGKNTGNSLILAGDKDRPCRSQPGAQSSPRAREIFEGAPKFTPNTKETPRPCGLLAVWEAAAVPGPGNTQGHAAFGPLFLKQGLPQCPGRAFTPLSGLNLFWRRGWHTGRRSQEQGTQRLRVPSYPSLEQALSHLCSGIWAAPTRGALQSSTSSALLPPDTALALLSSSPAERQGPGLGVVWPGSSSGRVNVPW